MPSTPKIRRAPVTIGIDALHSQAEIVAKYDQIDCDIYIGDGPWNHNAVPHLGWIQPVRRPYKIEWIVTQLRSEREAAA